MQTARRRSKLTDIERREGQASARDILEAERGLRSASNGLTQALVSNTTTRLEFLSSLGMIEVNENGQIRERKEALRFDRIAKRYPYVQDK